MEQMYFLDLISRYQHGNERQHVMVDVLPKVWNKEMKRNEIILQ